MADRDKTFLAELLQTITDRSLRWFGRGEEADADASPAALTQALLSTRGEASGVALARAIVQRWARMDATERRAWFAILAEELGPDPEALRAAIEAWTADPAPLQAVRLHAAAESRRQELLRRINLAPGGTATLVEMRQVLLDLIDGDAGLEATDADFADLLGSWFNRGFLLLRRIDWTSPADILEKIIRYEAVHEIRNWNDLRGRLKPSDRRCFAFFHPQMPDEPLIFVEVALTRGIPAEIGPLLAEERAVLPESAADCAVFYSISNTQAGLKGISFGNFLIKQVVEELLREVPGLKSFVTLSPAPGFAAWLAKTAAEAGEASGYATLQALVSSAGWHANLDQRAVILPALERAAASYLLQAKSSGGKPADAVARFHLNNGARLERINLLADLSAKGLAQSHGLMVNYLYDLASIERNHEHYANSGKIASAPTVKKLLSAEPPAALLLTLQRALPPPP